MSNITTNPPNATVDIFSGPPVKQMRISPLSEPPGTSSSTEVTTIPSSYHRTARRSARLAERNRAPNSHRNGIPLHVSTPATQQTLHQDNVINLITPPPIHSASSPRTTNPYSIPVIPHDTQATPPRSGPGATSIYYSVPSSQPMTGGASLVTDPNNTSSSFAPFMYSNLLHPQPTTTRAPHNSAQNHPPSLDPSYGDPLRPRAPSQEQHRESVIRNTHRTSRQRTHRRAHNPTRVPSLTEALFGQVSVEDQSIPRVPRLLTPSEQTVSALSGRPHWLHETVPGGASNHFDRNHFMVSGNSSEQSSHMSASAAPPGIPNLRHNSIIPSSSVNSSGPVFSPFVLPSPSSRAHDPLASLFSSNEFESWSPAVTVLPSASESSGPNTPARRDESPLARYSLFQPPLREEEHTLSLTSPQRPNIELAGHIRSQQRPTLIDHGPLLRPHPPPRPVTSRARNPRLFDSPSGSSSQTMPNSTAGRSSQYPGRSESSRSEAELIVVDDSDSDDDVIIESWIPGPLSSAHPVWRRGTHAHTSPQTQLDLDEAYARELQAHFDEEASMMNRVPGWPQQRQELEGNFGGGPVIPAGPSIPRPGTSRDNHPSGSGLIRDNFDALASRVNSWTREDASRFLHVASNSRSRTRGGGGVRSRRQLMENVSRMPTNILIQAIIGEHTSVRFTYEDLLELADNLGPARPQGLSRATLNRLPVTRFEKSDDNEDQRCVVCMSSYEPKEKVRSLPCTHEFHQGCIDQWFKDHRTCPICRVEVKS